MGNKCLTCRIERAYERRRMNTRTSAGSSTSKQPSILQGVVAHPTYVPDWLAPVNIIEMRSIHICTRLAGPRPGCFVQAVVLWAKV